MRLGTQIQGLSQALVVIIISIPLLQEGHFHLLMEVCVQLVLVEG